MTAFVEVPPYGKSIVDVDATCVLGKLDNSKEWFVTTPVVVLLGEGKVISAWEAKTPGVETILGKIVMANGQRGRPVSKLTDNFNISKGNRYYANITVE